MICAVYKYTFIHSMDIYILREKRRVVARKSHDTDPYSLRIRATPGVSCSMKRDVSAAFSPIQTFSVARKIRSPDTCLKRGVSRPGNCLIRPDFLRITVYRRLAQPLKLSIFTFIPGYLLGFDRSSTVLQVQREFGIRN